MFKFLDDFQAQHSSIPRCRFQPVRNEQLDMINLIDVKFDSSAFKWGSGNFRFGKSVFRAVLKQQLAEFPVEKPLVTQGRYKKTVCGDQA